MVIVGKKEAKEQMVSLRKRGMKNLGTMPVEELIVLLKKELTQKASSD